MEELTEDLAPYVAPFLRNQEVQDAISAAFAPDDTRQPYPPPPHALDSSHWTVAFPAPAAAAASTVAPSPGDAAATQQPTAASIPDDQLSSALEGSDAFLHHKLITRRKSLSHQPVPPPQQQQQQQTQQNGAGEAPQPTPRPLEAEHLPIVQMSSEAIIMLVEVIGFDRITQTLSKRGGIGWSEAVQGTAGRYICQIVDVVDAFDGDIVKFVGETIYIKWKLAGDWSSKCRQVQEAVSCGLQLLTELNDYTVELPELAALQSTIAAAATVDRNNNTMPDTMLLEFAGVKPNAEEVTGAGSVTINMRLRIAAKVGVVGEVVLGTIDRMEYGLYGGILNELADLAATTGIGELRLPAPLWTAIQPIAGSVSQAVTSINSNTATLTRAAMKRGNSKSRPASKRRGSENSAGGGSKGYRRQQPTMRRLSEVTDEVPEDELPVEPQGRSSSTVRRSITEDEEIPTEDSDDGKSLPIYQKLVSKLLLKRINGVSGDDLDLPRGPATVVTISIKPNSGIEGLQKSAIIAIEEAEANGGIFFQWYCAKNQRVIICLFGVDEPRPDHERQKQSALNSIKFSFATRRRLTDERIDCGISIVTGDVFFAILGNLSRSDVFLLSPATTYSLRELAIPEGTNRITCDEATQTLLSAATPSYSFYNIGKFVIQGYSKLASLTEVLDEKDLEFRRRGAINGIVGNKEACDRIFCALQSWLSAEGTSTGTSFFVTGPPGFGKTLLADQVSARIENANVLVCRGSATGEHRSKVAYGVSSVLLQAIFCLISEMIESEDQTSDDIVYLVKTAAKAAGIEDWITPLLLDALGVRSFQGDPTVWGAAIPPAYKDSVIQKSLLRILSHLASSNKFAIVFDDCQWLDYASAKLLTRMARDLKNIYILLLSRPVSGGKFYATYQLLAENSAFQQFTLSNVQQKDVIELLSQQWGSRAAGVSGVDSVLADMILKATSGDPQLTALVCSILRSRGTVGRLSQTSGPTHQPFARRMSVNGAGSLPGSTLGHFQMQQNSTAPQGKDGSEPMCPLFINDDGQLKGRRWPAVELNTCTLSEIVSGVIERAPSRLSELFQIASVLGYGFTLDDISALMDNTPSETEVLNILRGDCEGFIVEVVPMDFPLGGESEAMQKYFAFRSLSLSDIIYDALPNVKKQEIHSKIAEYRRKSLTPNSIRDIARLSAHIEKSRDLKGVSEILTQLAEHTYNFNLAQETIIIHERLVGSLTVAPDELKYILRLCEALLDDGQNVKARDVLADLLKRIKIHIPRYSLPLMLATYFRSSSFLGILKKHTASPSDLSTLLSKISTSPKPLKKPYEIPVLTAALLMVLTSNRDVDQRTAKCIASTAMPAAFPNPHPLSLAAASACFAPIPALTCLTIAASEIEYEPLESPVRGIYSAALGGRAWSVGDIRTAFEAWKFAAAQMGHYENWDIFAKCTAGLLSAAMHTGNLAAAVELIAGPTSILIASLSFLPPHVKSASASALLSFSIAATAVEHSLASLAAEAGLRIASQELDQMLLRACGGSTTGPTVSSCPHVSLCALGHALQKSDASELKAVLAIGAKADWAGYGGRRVGAALARLLESGSRNDGVAGIIKCLVVS